MQQERSAIAQCPQEATLPPTKTMLLNVSLILIAIALARIVLARRNDTQSDYPEPDGRAKS